MKVESLPTPPTRHIQAWIIEMVCVTFHHLQSIQQIYKYMYVSTYIYIYIVTIYHSLCVFTKKYHMFLCNNSSNDNNDNSNSNNNSNNNNSNDIKIYIWHIVFGLIFTYMLIPRPGHGSSISGCFPFGTAACGARGAGFIGPNATGLLGKRGMAVSTKGHNFKVERAPSLKLTARTWNTGVGRWVSFWGPAYWQVRTVSFRGCTWRIIPS